MENSEFDLQKNIQALVNNELDRPERQALLEQARADAAVADELAFSRGLTQALRHPDLLQAHAVLRTVINEEGFPPPSPKAGPGKGWWWAGLIVVVLGSLAGGYVWLYRAELFPSASQQLARETMQPLENVLFLPDSGAGLADLQAGMQAYDAGLYAEAARRLETYLGSRNDNAVRVYLGVSHLLSEQPQAAIAPLADASRSKEPPVREAALWYLALAYLGNNQPAAAHQVLDMIPPDSLYGPAAQELLKKIPGND